MQTVAFYTLHGHSKAKTAKAILLEDKSGHTAWIPTSIASVKFTGPNYKVEVVIPDWFHRKISWKAPVIENPKVGEDIGNLMEEKMVLEEINTTESMAKAALIDDAVKIMTKTYSECRSELLENIANRLSKPVDQLVPWSDYDPITIDGQAQKMSKPSNTIQSNWSGD